MHILIAEDDQLLQKVIQRRAEEEGLVTSVASNGRTTLDLLSSNDFDVLLLDLNMPVMSGIEVLKELKKQGNKIPVIVFTNYPREYSQKEVFDLGAKAFFEKSDVEVDDLMQAIQQYT